MTAVLTVSTRDAFEGSVGARRNGATVAKAKSPLAPYHNTDAGNAARFAAQHGADVRFCSQWSKYLVWDGKRWASDADGDITRRAIATSRSMYVEASKATHKKDADALGKWAAASESRGRLAAMTELAKSQKPIPVSVDKLDAKPWLLNCANGTINLRTGELREHRREDLLTKICPVAYPTDLHAPALFLRTLDRVFAGNNEIIQFVKRLLGMSLVGEVQEHVLPIFYGAGSNGKSTLIETWSDLLGPDYAMKAPHGLLMASKHERHPTELADLHGKRFVAAVETDYGKRLSEALVKELTGGDTIRARRMNENFWQFPPSHTIVLATNHKPTVHGTDHAIWRRLRLVPFTVTIPDSEADTELRNKLRAEWPRILGWAVQGCLDWQSYGLGEPDEVTSATNQFRSDSDELGKFIEECCVVGDGLKVQARDFFLAYKEWASEGMRFIENSTQFGLRLGERGFEKKKSGVVFYHGISLKKTPSDGDKQF